MSRIEAARRAARMSYLPYQARATVETLLEFPALNATLEGDQHTVYTDAVHLGIAVSLGEGGLIVPVIRDAQDLSVEGLAKRIKDIANRARSNQLTPDEVCGGTFTITNPGGYGSLMATPVINLPQVGDPRHRGRRQAPGRGHGRARQRLDRDPAHDVPVHVAGTTAPSTGRSPRNSCPRCARSWRPGRLARPRSDGHPPRACGPGAGQTRESILGAHGAVGLPSRPRRVPRGGRAAGAPARAGDRGRAARADAAARAPAGLHRRTPLGRGRAAVRRGLLPRARDRHRAHAARRQAHLPRPGAARRLPDHARRQRARVHPHDGARDRRRAGRRRASRRAPSSATSTSACGSASARSRRSASTSPTASRPRLRRQRRQRPRSVQLGRRLRAARGADDVAARPRASPRASPASASGWATASPRRSAAASGSSAPRGWASRRPRSSDGRRPRDLPHRGDDAPGRAGQARRGRRLRVADGHRAHPHPGVGGDGGARRRPAGRALPAHARPVRRAGVRRRGDRAS